MKYERYAMLFDYDHYDHNDYYDHYYHNDHYGHYDIQSSLKIKLF